jgi:hypothetical protein
MTHCILRTVYLANATWETLILCCLPDRGTYAHEGQRVPQVLLANPHDTNPKPLI